MSKSFTTITTDVSKALATLRKEIPETMQGFGAMSKAALAPGALSALDWPGTDRAGDRRLQPLRCVRRLPRQNLIRAGVTKEQQWKRWPSAPTWAAARP